MIPVRSVLTAMALLLASGQARAAEVSALIGQEPAAVRRAIGEVPDGWPVQPAFQLGTAEGTATFITVGDLMLDPRLAARLAVFRTRGDHPPTEPYVICRSVLGRAGSAAVSASSVVLVFRDGRLASAFRPIDARPEPPPATADAGAQKAYVRRPVVTPFVARPGELPLEDGVGFLARQPSEPLAPTDTLTGSCAPPPAPAPPANPAKARGLDEGDMQGLALLPFAVTLPGKNRQREAAARAGPTLLATLQVGAPLGATPTAFAAGHKGVRAYPSATGDYAVLSLDLGGAAGRNLTNFNDAALVGVRAGRIEWIAPPASYGPSPGLLCLDAQGVPNAPRPGCSGWGHFSP